MRGDLNSSAVTASQSKQKALDFAEFKKLHSLKVRGPSEPVGNLQVIVDDDQMIDDTQDEAEPF